MCKTPQELFEDQGEKVETELKNLFGEEKIEEGTSNTAVIHLKGGGNTTLAKLSRNGYIVNEIHRSNKDDYKYRAYISEADPEVEEKEVECHCCGKKTTKISPKLERVTELR